MSNSFKNIKMKNYLSLKKFDNDINFGFFKSIGGVSKGDYSSLNCSKSNKDKLKDVLQNIKIALQNLRIEKKKLKLINQTHSNNVFLINKKNYRKQFYGDGLITRDTNIALGVLTADCAPIFIFDKQKKIICCLHSGWKGALSNIINKALQRIYKEKIIKQNIIAVIGPCLASKNFEVDKDFKNNFIKKNILYKKFFKEKNKIKDNFNLRGLLNFQLKTEGISNIYNINKDTYKNSDIFFSHRRITHQNKMYSGRMINIISFKD